MLSHFRLISILCTNPGLGFCFELIAEQGSFRCVIRRLVGQKAVNQLSACIAAVERCGTAMQVECFNFPGDTEANARLIAAAPEMLEALKHADEACSQIVAPNEWPRDKIRAAIAKAEGVTL